MTQPDERDQVHPETRAQWRSWLAEHHATSDGVWLVQWRRQSGRRGPTYEEVVQEALCFGWIDSKAAKLDDDRTMMWVSPRKRGSGWARSNKLRIERLLADGLMAEAGLARIEEAKQDGSWTKLDAVEDLVVPDDLAAAFADNPGAREHWDGLPRSVRRAALEWIVQAKRPETRARRVTETARLAARGERPGQWRPRS
ncbi:MAG TPA: YdeI/OmpD-associated family protein [Propionibacteriaceae bacterium]|nr:YdeI/OmpD-associated family protein [Propionibacteriaceae bacterium]